ncbi:MAG: alpha/beta hydrolase [Eubacteriales bacterium]|nr:alpha/beta hydrolase [Eubacteriales bacterium]
MTVHEFGKENDTCIVLIHPSLVMWDYFERVIPLLEKDYHLIIPALPGYEPRSGEDFTSVEQIADELASWLNAHECHEIACLYGCSMGGSVVTKMLAENKLNVYTAVLDGGITPYQLPWIITRLIAVKDFCMISLGKIGGIRLLEKAFATDEYSKEDLQYMADIFKWLSYKTIWRTFESCNNYQMPAQVHTNCRSIQYWYGDKEKKERRLDLRYIRQYLPETKFVCMKNLGHGGMMLQRSEETAKRLRKLIEG